MNPVRLSDPAGDPLDLVLCGKCSRVFQINGTARNPIRGTPEQKAATLAWLFKRADECCDWKCPRCGVAVPLYTHLCEPCHAVRAAESNAKEEAKRYSEAKPDPTWDGPVMLPYGVAEGRDDRFFRDLVHLRDWVDGQFDTPGFVPPDYAWCCTTHTLKGQLDADRIIENATDEWPEEATADILPADVAELQTLLDGWAEGKAAECWEPDYTRYVPVAPRDRQPTEGPCPTT